MIDKPKPTKKDIKKLADLTIQLMENFLDFVDLKDISTFDLKDIRIEIYKKMKYHSDIKDFHTVFEQMWRVWPD